MKENPIRKVRKSEERKVKNIGKRMFFIYFLKCLLNVSHSFEALEVLHYRQRLNAAIETI